ncbi:DUF21 domain-containing protein At4g33700 [Selaginella moellendorffii]|uniref:DUF21 domain-containing protein At4g33700 n=1 Tax=Selaginella moellendorffii TaxID=88036 RepID=UPI000D1C4111|nr:DUF21 domain-containing protein At4g33700 [Selaginella moellendorffii]|eukprot:XP_024538876.1 DUF21 domain-containing protein At4g33700 [Selaginella moellendorffii]
MATHEHCCGPTFWGYIAIIVAIVAFAGLMSGLTLGLMSLELVDLEVLIKSGKEKDQKHAGKIYPVVRRQHLLLCTLLICNALAMEALPIFLDSLVPAWAAILISVTLILLFGEIFPQAVCSRYGLAVGATMAPFVRLLLVLCFPVAYPISKLLDATLGKNHSALFRRAELKTLVGFHDKEAGKGGELTHDETTIITGALELTEKTAKVAMTPLSSTFSIDVNAKLNQETMTAILTKGHSRVPVYSGKPTNVIGLVLVKNLLSIRPEDETPVRNVTIRKIPRVPESLPLYDILNEFQKGHSHMAVVIKDGAESFKKGLDRRLSSKRLVKNANGLLTTQASQKFNVAVDIDGDPGSEPVLVRKLTKGESVDQRRQNWQRARTDDILDVGPALSKLSADDEAVGIITMEDVIEELLQEEIWDETDEYVDIHNKIKVNMLPPEDKSPSPSALSSAFPTAAASPLSSLQPTPSFTSPVPSLQHTPAPDSPQSPHLYAPGPTPTKLASPCTPREASSPASSFANLPPHGSPGRMTPLPRSPASRNRHNHQQQQQELKSDETSPQRSTGSPLSYVKLDKNPGTD